MKKQVGPNNSDENMIQETIYRGSQSVNYKGLFTLKSTKKVQVLIKRDSYNTQSYAKIELFDGTKWNHLASLPFSEAASQHINAYARLEEISDDHVEMLAQDTCELLDLAAQILF